MKPGLLVFACAIAWQAAAWSQAKGGPAGNAPLEDTYWKLVQLGGEAVAAEPNQREAHFILHPATKHFSGSGGCNLMTGGYGMEDGRFTFERVITTMKACARGMDTERKFLDTLRRTRGAKVVGRQLELLDENGEALARLQAVHLR